MYEPRIYRERMGKERFISFTVTHLETDLWIAVDRKSYEEKMKDTVLKKIFSLRDEIEGFATRHPEFMETLTPLHYTGKEMPEIVEEMLKVSVQVGIGPMSAVAGAFSFYIGKILEKEFKVREVIVENGGDLYLNIAEDTLLTVHAGNSPLSEKVGLRIPAAYSPLGICTSAGTVGPSLNFGKADAVMIACKNPLLADSYATALSNKIKIEADINAVLAETEDLAEILAVVAIKSDKMGIRGPFELQLMK